MKEITRRLALTLPLLVIINLTGCATVNWPFTKEVQNREALSRIDRIALLDVPTSDELLNQATQTEMKNWLEQAGKKVILVEANRKNASKMLEDYDQFSHLDADAILEIAYYMLGYESDLSKGGRGKRLSPHVFLKYRLVSMKDGQILVQSNVRYSGFSYNLGLMQVPGTRLLGPREYIFPDQKSSEGKSEEIVARLNEAIKASTESIAKVITNDDRTLVSSYSGIRASAMDFFYSEAETEVDAGTYDKSLWDEAALKAGNDKSRKKARYVELRAKQSLQESKDLLSCSNAQSSLQDGISGTYVSDITCELCDHFRKYKDKTMVITLQQSGNSFTGKSHSSKDSSITGERDGDRYKFIYLSSPNSYEIRGEWKHSAVGCGLSGSWSHSVTTGTGDWNLTRIR